MAAFEWYGQDTGTALMAVGATDRYGFYGAAFNDAIETAAYQDTIHVENTSNTEICATAHLHNTKYIAAGSMDLDAGGGGALGAGMPTTVGCPIQVLFGHSSSVVTTDTTFWAYDGTTDSTGPADVTFYCGEASNATWTAADGSGAAMGLADDTTAATHIYYLFASASPDTVGVKEDFAMKLQLTYS